jgi:hypothetical protein
MGRRGSITTAVMLVAQLGRRRVFVPHDRGARPAQRIPALVKREVLIEWRNREQKVLATRNAGRAAVERAANPAHRRQLAGEPLDERTDIYSIGLILYNCLTGQDLFAAESVTAVVGKHAVTRTGELIRSHAMLPVNLQELLVSLLEENREQRTRNVRDVLERLTRRKIVALGLAATGEEGSQPTMPMIDQATIADRTPAVDAAAKRKERLKALLDEM